VVEQNLLAGSFTPTGNGLTAAGFAFIDAALKQSDTEKRVLIDIKHLSTVARNQAYAHIRTRFPGTPLLASHAGVTGMSWKDQPRRVDSLSTNPDFPNSLFARFDQLAIRGFMRNDDNGHLTSLTFNGWSVNLFDEDIIEIIASRGLIGIQFDPRILGVKGTEVERFSKKEYQQGWPNLPVVKHSLIDVKEAYTFDPLPDFIFGGTNNESSLHRWHFCQTIIHIALVITLENQAGNPDLAGIDPWNHICLGTDYDGLITAIKTAPKANTLSNLLNQETVDCLQAMAHFLNTRNGNFGGNPIIVPFDVLSKIQQTNGINFLRTHFI
jgi:microsomal dipeptidase-like Zn-dependent dipeptidase